LFFYSFKRFHDGVYTFDVGNCKALQRAVSLVTVLNSLSELLQDPPLPGVASVLGDGDLFVIQ